MAKAAAGLTVAEVRSLAGKRVPGRHAAGNNLYLTISKGGASSWTLRYMVAGKAREMGLGSVDPDGRLGGVTLADARAKAAGARRLLLAGKDPLGERDAVRQAAEAERVQGVTFQAVAEAYVAAHEVEWKNPKHRQQWRNTLATYVYPLIGALPVAEVGPADVRRVLEPVWVAKPETASRIKTRVLAILDHAAAADLRPATAIGAADISARLRKLLPKLAKVKKAAGYGHHKALAWHAVWPFMVKLRARQATAARALEFTILTATRTGEARGARWSEMDLQAGLWTIPADRMKAGREHRVPLSGPALAVVEGMLPLRPEKGDGFVFPGQSGGKSLSENTLLALLGRMGFADVTVHGFRSTFSDWASDSTSHPHAVVEMALAHAIESKTEAAYRRGDLFAKRKVLMEEWAAFCDRPPAEVVALRPSAPLAAVS